MDILGALCDRDLFFKKHGVEKDYTCCFLFFKLLNMLVIVLSGIVEI